MTQKDLLIGAFDNYDWNQLAPWVNSIKESGFTGDVVLVCFNASFPTVEKLIEKGVMVVACAKSEHGYTHESNMPIHTERFFHFFSILQDNAVNYRYVITTDVKDVIFQRNPSEWLENIIDLNQQFGPKIIASDESIRYRDEPWGNDNLEKCFGPYFHSYFKNNKIYNVGVIAGDAFAMRDICLNLFLMSINRPIPIVDQAVWNAMLATIPYRYITYYSDMIDSWAVHLGTTMDPQKIEQFRPYLTNKEPIIKNMKVFNADDKEFYIVHQWDRVDTLNRYYRNKYDY